MTTGRIEGSGGSGNSGGSSNSGSSQGSSLEWITTGKIESGGNGSGSGSGNPGGNNPASNNPGDNTNQGNNDSPGDSGNIGNPVGGNTQNNSNTPNDSNNENSENGGDSGSGNENNNSSSNTQPPPPPPPPDYSGIAEEKAQPMHESGRANANTASITLGTVENQASIKTEESKTTTADNGNKGKADRSGDPVLVTSGSYLFDVEDYEIIGSSFRIKRRYISDNRITGSIGTGWSFSADSRIMRGITKFEEALLSQSDSLLKAASQCSEDIKKEADNLLEKTKNLDPATRQKAEETYSKLMSKVNELRNEIQNGRQKLEELLIIQAQGQKLAALNKYAKFRGTPEFYETAGNGYLVLIDENGIPLVFAPSGSGTWIPISSPECFYEKIASVNGGGADSTAGFVLTERGGRKKHYDGNGMLIGVTELNGDHVEILRNANEKATRIRGPHGNEWTVEYSGEFIGAINGPEKTKTQYGYNGDDLVSVQDKEGDTGKYNYIEDRLNEIVKPDGSAIRLEYGYTGSGGVKLVTTTTHEEGASERFDYNPSQKVTTYTNHSGVITRYWYDDKHRTIREEHSDGRVITFTYNGSGLLERETLNGFEIRYNYDGRGNVTEKRYADGKMESWQWSGSDQQLKYTDRDNVVTEFGYDSQWNCTEIRRGGQVIYTARYDQQNRLIASKEGNHSEIKYEYDEHDFISLRNITINGKEIKEKWKYDALGRLTKYTDGLGRAWEYTYNAKDTIEITPLGLERRYEYNNRKDLVRIVEKDLITGEERERKYVYDKRHLLTEETDGVGNAINYTYREDGELIKKEQGPWYWEYAYEVGGRVSTVTMGKTGTNKKYTEDYGYRWQGWNEERTVTVSGAGTTAYQLDPWGRVTMVTNAVGDISSRALNGVGNVLREQGTAGGFYEYRYDSLGRPYQAGREGEQAVQIKYNLDGSIAEKIDRVGNVTQYAYDGRGSLIGEKTVLGEQRYYYDDAGRLIRQETASRNSGLYRTDWNYNDSQRTVTVTSGGTYTETLYLNAWGEVTRQLDGEGNERRYEYDKAGKLVKTIDGYGRATTYAYNELEKVSAITYADGTTERYEYDHTGNLQEIRDAIGISWAGEYDQAGRLSKETGRPGIDKEYKYDAIGRIVEVKSGGEVVERYSYSNRGREAVFTDGAGNGFTQQKNAFGELTGETNRLTDSQRYSYDGEGRITANTAYSGKQTKVEYRDNEGITITTYSDGKQDIIERDMLGNIIRVTNETGTIRYKYDAGGKLIEQTDEGAGEKTYYTYNKSGQRIRMQSGNRDIIYRYGKNGELLKVTDNSQRLEVSYEYDNRGREIRRVYGNGVRQETFYDQIGRTILIRETDSRGSLLRAEGYVYDEKGRRSHSVDEEGRVTKYEYDRQSRLSTVLYPWTKEKAEADRKEAEEAGLYFTQDKGNGERYSFSNAEQAMLREILNKAGPMRGNAVASSQMVWRESYTYDRNGNRASKATPWGTIKYVYDAENRLVKKGDIVYTNDKDGNTLSEKGLRYEAVYQYNGQNRMVSSVVTNHVERTSVANNYAYDALGRRTITENVTGETIRILYDGKGFEAIREGETFRDGSFTTRYAPAEAASSALSNQATGERYRWVGDNENTRTRNASDEYTVQNSRYNGRGVTLYGNGEAVAVSYSSGGGSRSMYMGKDVMGSVRSVTIDTGTLEDRYEYDAFGQPYKGDLTGGMNLGYTGKPYDSATGLYNYGYRDYKPQAARFTTLDPIRDGNNWFAYVNNDPVNWVDLWGLREIYADDIHGKPIAVSYGTDLKDKTAIVIERNGSAKTFSDTLNVNIGNQTLIQLPVQSTANIPEPRLTEKYNGRTLDPGVYTGTFLSQSGKYLNAILIAGDDFLIHPNEVTVPKTKIENIAAGTPNGPFYNEVSAGCQVLTTSNFNTLTSTLQGIGFQYNGKDTISVTIKSKSK